MNRLTRTTPALAVMALLAACGGGADGDGLLSAEVAQGYAADAATMPVSATSNVDAAMSALETALGSGAAADAPTMQAQAAQPAGTGAASCPRGGSLSWSVSGPAATVDNGQLDAGETFSVTYTGCITEAGSALDGSLQVVVAARGTGTLDFTVSANALKTTTASATYLLNGSLREQRTSRTTTSGGNEVTGRVSSTGLSLQTTRGTRVATYELRSLDWTIVRTFGVTGLLESRTHSGTLQLTANTPRRPAASLSITASGGLTIGPDGFANGGQFTVVTARDTIACTYGNGTATLTLDRGSDGSIDRSWTIQRTDFIDAAG